MSAGAIPRRYWIALGLSVTFNLFCAGLIAQRALHFRAARQHLQANAGRPGTPGTTGGHFLQRSGLLQSAPEVRAVLDRAQPRVLERRQTLAKARDDVRSALQAEPFDAARLDQALSVVREQTAPLQADLHAVLIQVADKLNAAQRKRIADALWRRKTVQATWASGGF